MLLIWLPFFISFMVTVIPAYSVGEAADSKVLIARR